MTPKQRDALLAQMTGEVASLVLRHNYRQTQALANAAAQASQLVDVHARYIRSLQQLGRLDRDLEFLPSDEELAERKIAGAGLTSPEFAVLLAHTKIALHHELLDSDIPEDPFLRRELERYFPTPLRERFRDRMDQHRLRREITVTCIVNEMVDRAGTTFAFRLGDETGAGAVDICRAWTFAREVFDMRDFWAAVEALDNAVPAAVQTTMLLEARKLVERATRWVLRHRGRPLDIARTVAALAPGVRELAAALPGLLVDGERRAWQHAADRLLTDGVPADLARRVAGFDAVFAALDVVEVASETDEAVEAVAAVYFSLGDRLELHWLRDQIVALPRDNRWQSLARAALREDLYAQQRALTAEVLHASASVDAPGARIDAWIARNRGVSLRCAQVVSDIKASGPADLATLSVALRENHNLVTAGRR
jgi:glutamate dehydrogenase